MVELPSCGAMVNASALQEVKGESVSLIAEISAELPRERERERERERNAEMMEKISVLEAQIEERDKDPLLSIGQEHVLCEIPGVRWKIFYPNRQIPILCPVRILEEEKEMRPSDGNYPSFLFLCIKYGGRTRNLPQYEYVMIKGLFDLEFENIFRKHFC